MLTLEEIPLKNITLKIYKIQVNSEKRKADRGLKRRA